MVHALAPIVRCTLVSVAQAGIAAGMLGSVSLGDIGSMQKYVTAIGAFDPQALVLYR